MKKIWIIAPFANIDDVGVRNRFQYLANRLHEEGQEVVLFTSSFRHKTKKHINKNVQDQYPYSVVIINEPGYKKNVSVKRVLSHIKFALNLKNYMNKVEVPDIIYAAYPTMSSANIAGKFSKKNSVPFVIDIQDIWPESISSAIDTEKNIVKILMWPLTSFANKIYKMADVVFGVSDTYAQRANVNGTGCREFIPVYIGAELQRFDNAKVNEHDVMEKNEADIWITYIGTLSHSYDVDTAIKTFAELKDYKNIKLNILGSGPDEERLMRLAKELGVYDINVYFHGYVHYEKMVSTLKRSDLALNALTSGAKQTITNKFGDYVSAGLPILNSSQEKEVIDLVNIKGLGINYIPGDITSLKNAILKIIIDGEKILKYGKNSRLFAEEYFDRKESYGVIVDKIREL